VVHPATDLTMPGRSIATWPCLHCRTSTSTPTMCHVTPAPQLNCLREVKPEGAKIVIASADTLHNGLRAGRWVWRPASLPEAAMGITAVRAGVLIRAGGAGRAMWACLVSMGRRVSLIAGQATSTMRVLQPPDPMLRAPAQRQAVCGDHHQHHGLLPALR
jgi:hypothetical protein